MYRSILRATARIYATLPQRIRRAVFSLPKPPNGAPQVLIVDEQVPTPDRDSGSIDCWNFCRLLIEEGAAVSFLPIRNPLPQQPYSKGLNEIGVETLHAPRAISALHVLEARRNAVDIVILNRRNIALATLPLVRRLMPWARIVFNPVDLHFLREKREAVLAGDNAAMKQADLRAEQEFKLVRAADLTIAISPVEAEILRRACPNSNIIFMPLIRDAPVNLTTPGLEGRRDLVFVGNYRHTPNRDAARLLVAEIWPHIARADPLSRLHLVGGGSSLSELAAPRVILHGHVPDLDSMLARMRVNLAPLRYGAGLKGKIAGAILAGVPTVATSIAAEGMPFLHDEQILLADTVESFAAACLRLLTDDDLWLRLRGAGFDMAQSSYSLEANRPRVQQILAEMAEPRL